MLQYVFTWTLTCKKTMLDHDPVSGLGVCRFLEAAHALEECDPAFKPVFASKPGKNSSNPPSSGYEYGSGGGGPGGGAGYGGPGPAGPGMWGPNQYSGAMGQQSGGLPSPPSVQVRDIVLLKS